MGDGKRASSGGLIDTTPSGGDRRPTHYVRLGEQEVRDLFDWQAKMSAAAFDGGPERAVEPSCSNV